MSTIKVSTCYKIVVEQFIFSQDEKLSRLIRGFGGLQSGLHRNSFRSKHLAQGAGDAGSLPQLYVTPGVRLTPGHPSLPKHRKSHYQFITDSLL